MLHLLIDTCVWLDLAKDYRTNSRQMSLRGVSEALTIYEIREREPAAAKA